MTYAKDLRKELEDDHELSNDKLEAQPKPRGDWKLLVADRELAGVPTAMLHEIHRRGGIGSLDPFAHQDASAGCRHHRNKTKGTRK